MSLNAGYVDTIFPWTIPISLLVTHFIGDFLLQSDWMAGNKSKWNQSFEGAQTLVLHVLLYSMCFLAWGLEFAVVTALLHLLVDACTSKLTSRLWFFKQGVGEAWYPVAGKRHWFFVAIGADQVLHYLALAWAWGYFHG